MRIVAGIDPGLNGGVAVVNEQGLLETAILPTMGEGTDRVLDCAQLASWIADRDVTEVIIERAQAMRGKDDGRKQGTASSFRYGVSYGQILGMLQAMLLPYQTVHPLTWKRRYGLLNNKRLGIIVDKDASRRRAIELFPACADQFKRKTVDGHRAEAALLARYAMNGGGR